MKRKVLKLLLTLSACLTLAFGFTACDALSGILDKIGVGNGGNSSETSSQSSSEENVHTHTYAEETTAPTCTEQGFTTYTCECGDSYVDDYLDILEHIYTNYVSDNNAKCGEDGTKTAVCDHGCGAKDTVTDEGSALQHSYTNYVSDNNAKCGEDGTKTAVCDHGCGTEDTVADEGTALQHSYTNYLSDHNAKCGEDGTKTAVCDHGCGTEDTVADEGTALQHSYTNYVSDHNAKCGEDGTKTALCDNNCGTRDTVADEGSAKQHSYMNYVSDNNATCEKDGTKTAECYYGCGTKNTVTDVVATGHKYENKVCTVCGGAYYSQGLRYALSEDGTYYKVTGIGSCVDTDVVVPAKYKDVPVTQIGYRAFYGSRTLTGIEIPDSVTKILEEAFSECGKLTNVALGNGITKIAYRTFYYCKALANVEIPNGVTEIGDYAFSQCGKLTSIVIPDSVTKIGSSAFKNCGGLANVELGNGMTTIGWEMFYGCSSLTSVTIPDSVTSISLEAFARCTNLTNVILGNNVVSIDSTAFERCDSLQFNESDNAYYFGSKDNPYYALMKAKSTDIVSCEIHNEARIIAGGAFSSCGLTSVTIGEGIIAIGGAAFSECTALKEIKYNATECADFGESGLFGTVGQDGEGISVTIGANVKKIPAYLFYKAAKIVSVEFEEGSVCETIGDYAFAKCTSLTSVEIGSTVSTIGKSAFSECKGLTEIKYNATNCTYRNTVFSKAGQDGEGILVTIGANVKSIPSSLFYFSSVDNAPKIVSVDFEEGSVCENIGAGAFKNCSGLTSVEICESVTVIGGGAFSNCTGLTEIKYNATECTQGEVVFGSDEENGADVALIIGANVKRIPKKLFQSAKIVSIHFEENSVCESIGEYAFYDCDRLTNVTIPNSVTNVETRAFSSCDSLENVVIGNGVTDIAKYMFSGCTSLKNVTMSKGVTVIGSGAFHNCSSLTSIEIPDGVTEIGDEAFQNCTALTSIEIPEAVTELGTAAFYNCTALTEIRYNATGSNLEYHSKIFYRAGQSGDGITVIIGVKVKKLPQNLFYSIDIHATGVYSPKIVTVVFEKGGVCEKIDSNAFRDCDSLTNVYYGGTAEDWANMSISLSNDFLTNATRYYYSETQPTETGNYWHYVDGKVTVW